MIRMSLWMEKDPSLNSIFRMQQLQFSRRSNNDTQIDNKAGAKMFKWLLLQPRFYFRENGTEEHCCDAKGIGGHCC